MSVFFVSFLRRDHVKDIEECEMKNVKELASFWSFLYTLSYSFRFIFRFIFLFILLYLFLLLMLDITLIILATLCMIIGLAWSVLPVLPGAGVSYIWLLLLWAVSWQDIIGLQTLVVWALIVVVLTVIDYLIPLRWTQKMWWTKGGKRWSMIWVIWGLRRGPLWIIIWPFVGAFLGEYIMHRNRRHAFRAALWAFGGFVVGTWLKIIACAGMCWYVISVSMSLV